jgi:hypothetical protein
MKTFIVVSFPGFSLWDERADASVTPDRRVTDEGAASSWEAT